MTITLDAADFMTGRALVLDTETTGFSPRLGDRIVEIGVIEIENGRPTGRHFHRFCNPGRPSHPAAQDIHGLTEAFLATQPDFADVAAELMSFLSPQGAAPAPLWCHNARFDQRFVAAEFAKIGLHLPNPVFCSLELSGLSLSDLAEATGYDWGNGRHHSALCDAQALAHALTTELWPKAQSRSGFSITALPAPDRMMPDAAA